MRVAGMAFLLLLMPSALADTANVAKASELLDFDIAKPPAVKEAGLAALDIDGDGQISKAEAAGNAEVTGGFDRADRNRNGKVSVAEWERYEKWQERRAKEREARLARSKAKGSASAGGTAAKKPRGSAP
ncbi:MAG TPA: hypothetical protein VIQ55_04885 [Burkholderiales bacterium]|jgi:hypothetical protein